MIDPERRRAANSSYRKTRSAAGRWSLLRNDAPRPEDAIEQARFKDKAIESAAHVLLNRYGVVFRDLLAFESNVPRWGQLLRMFRRLEDRGVVRGGRFVSGFGGEQFALPEVLESLHAAKHRELKAELTIAGADPLNLVGILIPGDRIPAVPGRRFVLTNAMFEHSGVVRTQQERRVVERVGPRSAIPVRAARVNDVQRPTLFEIPSNA
jgi:ATP-dependent Lhr-like helicase